MTEFEKLKRDVEKLARLIASAQRALAEQEQVEAAYAEGFEIQKALFAEQKTLLVKLLFKAAEENAATTRH